MLSRSLREAELEARTRGLEEALAARSRELRELQRLLCSPDLLAIARSSAAHARYPLQAFELSLWRETTELTRAQVTETMGELWSWVGRPTSSG